MRAVLVWPGHVASRASRAAGLAVVGLFLVGSGTTQRVEEPDLPTLTLHKEDLGPRSPAGAECPSPAEVSSHRGSPPSGARQVLRMQMTADRPVPLRTFEEAMQVEAANACAEGISVLRAEVADGATGFTSVEAVAWSKGGP